MKNDYIAVADHSPQEIEDVLSLALRLKKEWKAGGNKPVLKNKTLAMVFQKPSLRTRVSFDMAMRHLGGDALYLSPAEIGLGKRESIADVARVLSGYVDAIMARVFEHDHILQLAEWASVPVINGLTDYNHPCQGMADALTIQEEFGTVKDLQIVFIGDGNNVAVSLLHIAAKLGAAKFTIACPEGYEIPEAALTIAKPIMAETGTIFEVVRDPREAVQGAQVIYTDTWTSMGQEAETAIREQHFALYQVNDDLVNAADPQAIVMHCLPAHRGQEITNEVADGPHSRLFPQAENRMHAQKAILVNLLGE
ncbi:MAG: ornithine carbamoyltransferase [Anaerolineaceae bacterium]|jgi:ornithine carbamoyltransferase|nr:ornithine carbamoyltransferase [Anaerolineaceae bacterium]